MVLGTTLLKLSNARTSWVSGHALLCHGVERKTILISWMFVFLHTFALKYSKHNQDIVTYVFEQLSLGFWFMTPTMGMLKKPAPPMFIIIHSNWIPTRINHGLCRLTSI